MIKFLVLNVPIYLSYSFVFVLSLLSIIDKTGYLTASMFSVLIHEFGHILALKHYRIKINSLDFSLGRIRINAPMLLVGRKKIFVSLSGPLINLLLSLLIFLKSNYLKAFGVCNLLVAIFNLIPAKGLDGGDILYCLLKPFKCGRFIFYVLSYFVQVQIILMGVFVLVHLKGNPSLLIVGLYLFIFSFYKN